MNQYLKKLVIVEAVPVKKPSFLCDSTNGYMLCELTEGVEKIADSLKEYISNVVKNLTDIRFLAYQSESIRKFVEKTVNMQNKEKP